MPPSRILRTFVLLIVFVIGSSRTETAEAGGFVPRGTTYLYEEVVDSTVSLSFGVSFEDSSIYAGADSFVVQRDDVIRAQWSQKFQGGLVQWFRNSDPSNPAANEIQLVGFDRPALRVFYEPPLPWVASDDRLAGGDSTWTWVGRVSVPAGVGSPDSLRFSIGALDTVALFGGVPALARRIRVEDAAVLALPTGESVDLSGRNLSGVRARRFLTTDSWYGSARGNGQFLRILFRDDQVVLHPEGVVPVTKASMGSLRWLYRSRGRNQP